MEVNSPLLKILKKSSKYENFIAEGKIIISVVTD